METHLCGVRNINHEHREVPPVIHIHNKTPFANYETALDELKKKILHPGEIAVAYYYNPTADDGISTLIATGPIQQGGYNEIFKNAADIDQLVEELNLKIDTQDQHVSDMTEEVKNEIIQRAADMNAETKEEIVNIINSSLAEITENLNTYVSEFTSNVNTSISEFTESVNASFQNINNSIDASYIYLNNMINEVNGILEDNIESLSSSTSEKFDSVYVELDGIKDMLGVDSSGSGTINKIKEEVESNSNALYWRPLGAADPEPTDYGYWRDLTDSSSNG